MTAASATTDLQGVVTGLVRCRHTRVKGAVSQFRCSRAATKDGYCTSHHPDYISPRAKAALDEFDKRLDSGVDVG